MDLTDNKSNEEEQHQGLLNGRSNRRTIYGYPEMQHNENQLHKLCLNENDAGSIRVPSISFCKKNGIKNGELNDDCYVKLCLVIV